jgi:hypothetical protein
MAFDMGFDFRGTAGYVTDQAFAVPVLGEAYPHTYTNANGKSINAGVPGGTAEILDRDATNDARIAGIMYKTGGGTLAFQVDLLSGSAPGAGSYTVDVAAGDALAGAQYDNRFQVLDTATVLIDSGDKTLNNNLYIDATLAVVAATNPWTGSTVVKSFATTLAKYVLVTPVSNNAPRVAHFRLTLVPPAIGATGRHRVPRYLRRLHLMGQGRLG